MIPVYQDTHDNCFQACVASMFEVPLSEVPHFVAEGNETKDPMGYLPTFRAWCRPRGVYPIEIPMQGLSLAVVLTNLQLLMPDAHYIIGGPTLSGGLHAVVACGGSVVHDPEPDIARHLKASGFPERTHCLADTIPADAMWIVTFFGCSTLAYGKAAAGQSIL